MKVQLCRFTVDGANRPASRMAENTSSPSGRDAKRRRLRRSRMIWSSSLPASAGGTCGRPARMRPILRKVSPTVSFGGGSAISVVRRFDLVLVENADESAEQPVLVHSARVDELPVID